MRGVWGCRRDVTKRWGIFNVGLICAWALDGAARYTANQSIDFMSSRPSCWSKNNKDASRRVATLYLTLQASQGLTLYTIN